MIVRLADDFIVGFEHQDDAERFLADLRERFAKFALELNAEKTRLIEFGRFAAERRKARGLGKPETFTFLGFTHICARDRNRAFQAQAHHGLQADACQAERGQGRDQTTAASARSRPGTLASQRPARALQLLRGARQRRGRCTPFATRSPGTGYRALRRRSQRTKVTGERMTRLIDRWLPKVRILHPWPETRFDANIQGRSPVR